MRVNMSGKKKKKAISLTTLPLAENKSIWLNLFIFFSLLQSNKMRGFILCQYEN